MKKKKVVIRFQDKGQDCLRMLVNFDADWKLGVVVDSDLQQSVWVGQYVISGEPKIGSHIVMSKAPGSSTYRSYDVESYTEVSSGIKYLTEVK